MTRYATTDAVRNRANGNWPAILTAAGIDAAQLDTRTKKTGAPCPLCGGADRYFFDDYGHKGGWRCRQCRPQAGDGWALLMKFKGWTFVQAKDFVSEFLGVRPLQRAETPAPRPAPTPATEDEAITPPDRVVRLWDLSKPIAGTPAETYLRVRGIRLDRWPDDLRFTAAAPYFDGEDRRCIFGALLAAVRGPDGRLRTVHRTFLRGAEKARVDAPKKLASPTGRGAAIHLYRATDVLHLAEGIENALAVHVLTQGAPAWSCVSAQGLATIHVPKSVRRVVIWADLDESRTGERAAHAAMGRLLTADAEVEIMLPTGKPPRDWLDVLREDAEAIAGVRA
jgi:putative DNA primase/helicase